MFVDKLTEKTYRIADGSRKSYKERTDIPAEVERAMKEVRESGNYHTVFPLALWSAFPNEFRAEVQRNRSNTARPPREKKEPKDRDNRFNSNRPKQLRVDKLPDSFPSSDFIAQLEPDIWFSLPSVVRDEIKRQRMIRDEKLRQAIHK